MLGQTSLVYFLGKPNKWSENAFGFCFAILISRYLVNFGFVILIFGNQNKFCQQQGKFSNVRAHFR